MRVPDIRPPEAIHGLALFPLRERWLADRSKVWSRQATIGITAEALFIRSWRKAKAEWVARGFSLRQENGKWTLQQWLAQDADGYSLTKQGVAALARLTVEPELIAAPVATIPDLPPLPDGLEDKLKPYQVQASRQLFRALTCGPAEWGYAGAWDCSDLGVGKTYQTLAAAIATGKRPAIVCPLGVIPAWHRACAHFGISPQFVLNYEALKTGNRDYVDKHIADSSIKFEWDLDPETSVLILDEAHLTKTVGSLNQGMAMAAIRKRIPMIMASATLATKPTHLRAAGKIVGLHWSKLEYFKFLADHACTAPKPGTGHGYNWRSDTGPRGKSALARIHSRVFPMRGARTRIADLGDAFPKTQIMAQSFETGATQQINMAFNAVQEKLRKLVALGMSTAQAQGRLQMEYMEAWHNSERAKIPALVDMVHSEQEAGQSVAVFMNFNDTREALMAATNCKCAIYGGQKDRQSHIDDFQANRSRLIIAQIKAGGVGVDMHDVHGGHPRTSIILPTNNPVDINQALGRVRRSGGQSESRQIIFFAAGSVEEGICNNVRNSINSIKALNDGDLTPAPVF